MSKFNEEVIITSRSTKKTIAKSLYISKALNEKLRILMIEYNKDSAQRVSTNEILNLLIEKQVDKQIQMLKFGKLNIY